MQGCGATPGLARKLIMITKKLETLLHSTENEAIVYHRCNVSIDNCIKNHGTIGQFHELRVERKISVGVLSELDKIAKNALSAREYGYYRQRAAIMISPLLLLNE